MEWRVMPRSWGKDIGGVPQEIGTDGRSHWGRPWLKVGCCANDCCCCWMVLVFYMWSPHKNPPYITYCRSMFGVHREEGFATPRHYWIRLTSSGERLPKCVLGSCYLFSVALVWIVATPQQKRQDWLMSRASQIVACAHLAPYLRPQSCRECVQLLIMCCRGSVENTQPQPLDFAHTLKFPEPLQNYIAILKSQALRRHFVLQVALRPCDLHSLVSERHTTWSTLHSGSIMAMSANIRY